MAFDVLFPKPPVSGSAVPPSGPATLRHGIARHVSAVQNRFVLKHTILFLGWTLLAVAVASLMAVAVHVFLQYTLPRPMWWLYGSLAAAGAVALVLGVRARPTALAAAAKIDEALGLKEKFSTAVYLTQPQYASDPYATLALADADRVASGIDLRGKFPLEFPKPLFVAGAVALVAVLVGVFVPPVDLFGRAAAQEAAILQQQRQEQAHKVVQDAMALINQAVPEVASTDEIQLAKNQLAELMKQPNLDPNQAARTAAAALSQLNESIKKEIESNGKFAQARQNQRIMRALGNTKEEGPVADAKRDLAEGNITGAIEKLDNLVKNFDKMSDQQKQQAAQQMAQMAQQLTRQSNDPQQQQQIARQLQQMGVSPQQAQQMVQQMQQAAQGDQQAAQQLAQQASQMMQNMPPAQQARAQQMLQQLQAQASGQAMAQQMQQAAQQMAQAMQQQTQAGQQGVQQAGQQPGQQQGGQQGMNQAAQQMQTVLQQMQAMQSDMRQAQAQQNQAQQMAQNAAGQCNGGGQGQQAAQHANQGVNQHANRQQASGQGQGSWQAGDGPGQGQGMGGPGQGMGGRAPTTPAPFSFKDEISKSQDNDKGKTLASSFVKADQLVGESTAALRDVVMSNVRDSTDEVDRQRVGRQAANAVRDYFKTLGIDPDAVDPSIAGPGAKK